VYVTILLLICTSTQTLAKKYIIDHLANELSEDFEMDLSIRPDHVIHFGDQTKAIKMALVLEPQCPHCHEHFQALKKLIEAESPHISLEIFWFPVDADCNPNAMDQNFPNSCKLVSFFSCMGPRSNDTLVRFFDRPALATIPIDRNVEKFWGIEALPHDVWACFESSENKSRLTQRLEEMYNQGVQSTPLTLLKGKAYEGAWTYEMWKKIINKERLLK
jgi:protein-disulfide isomerase